MKNLFLSITFCLITFICGQSIAAPTNKVTSEQAELTLLGGKYTDNTILLGLNVRLQPGWHIYWRYAGDTGFPPILDWSGSTNLAGVEFLWPAPQRYRQELQPGNFSESYVYNNNVTFPIVISAKDATKAAAIAVHVSYAVCAEICIPGHADLSLNLQPGYLEPENMAIITAARKLVPQENGSYGITIENISKGQFIGSGQPFIEVTANNINGKFSKNATLLIEGGEHFAFTNPTTAISGNIAKFIMPVTFLTEKKDFSATSLVITLINGEQAVELARDGAGLGLAASINPAKNDDYGAALLLLMVAFGFIGGLILNIMPCVLPILSLKLLGVIKHGGGKKADVAASFLMSALGIMTSFIALALITIWLKEAGEVVGWGFGFQEPYFIITLVIILTLFAANLWGLFEIKLPSHFGNIGAKYEGMAGHFVTGVMATILATPCTAPFLGTAVGFSLTHGTWAILAIFTAMGLGLASPYLFFSLFPHMVTKLPKPGAWMVRIKHLMGVLLAVAAIWLIWVLSNQLGKYAALALLFLSIAKLLKLWASRHYSTLHKVKIPLLAVIIVLSFIIPIKISTKSDLQIPLANREIWEDFRPEHIPQLVANGKVVFVDVTADWCLTCKVNKLVALDSDAVKAAFMQMDVVAMKADWTNRDAHIAQYLMKYERVGIPFNIVYGPAAPEGIVLSELLSKSKVIEALAKAR